ncbi:MAG: phosphate-selective porin OprO/OprP, partial [Verrucomicrobiales bacterium]
LIYADGYDGDAYGAIIIPTYDLTEKLQLVGRYQYAHGDNDSLRAQSRYERRVPDITDGGRGEEYHAFYTGLNYYICDHKLKLMAGAEYADLQDKAGDGGDFEGWTLFTGVRMYF